MTLCYAHSAYAPSRLVSYLDAFLQCSFCFRFLVTCTFAFQIGPSLSPVRTFLPPGRRRRCPRYSFARRLRRRTTPFHDHASSNCVRSAPAEVSFAPEFSEEKETSLCISVPTVRQRNIPREAADVYNDMSSRELDG